MAKFDPFLVLDCARVEGGDAVKFFHLATLPSEVTPRPQRIQLRKMTLETQDLHSGGCLLPAERADQDTVPAGGRRGRSLPRELRSFPGGGWTARATGRSARGPGDATPSLRWSGIRQESENELSSHLQWGLFIFKTVPNKLQGTQFLTDCQMNQIYLGKASSIVRYDI